MSTAEDLTRAFVVARKLESEDLTITKKLELLGELEALVSRVVEKRSVALPPPPPPKLEDPPSARTFVPRPRPIVPADPPATMLTGSRPLFENLATNIASLRAQRINADFRIAFSRVFGPLGDDTGFWADDFDFTDITRLRNND